MKIFSCTTTLLAFFCLAEAGCQHYGPKTIVSDRIPYNQALATTWKEQTLLNIVKMRYLDTPFFIDVAQVTSGYTLQAGVAATGSITPPVSPAASFAQQLGAILNYQGSYQDRPTISYTPQTGAQFIRNLTTPITPSSILFLIESGYPADVVLDLSVESINDLDNRTVLGAQIRPADPRFTRLGQILRRAQISGNVGMRIEQDRQKKEATLLTMRDKDIKPELAAELAEVRSLLGLSPDAREFKVVFGGKSTAPNEIAILSRSVFVILAQLSSFVEVPDVHLASGTAPNIGDPGIDEQSPLRVYNSGYKPKEAFVAICYEDHWYWIEKRDTLSKRTLNYVLLLLAQADTGPKEGLPLVTIQAN
jgi:hypothetical protein